MGLEHGGVDRPNGPAHEHHASVAELKEHNVSKFQVQLLLELEFHSREQGNKKRKEEMQAIMMADCL